MASKTVYVMFICINATNDEVIASLVEYAVHSTFLSQIFGCRIILKCFFKLTQHSLYNAVTLRMTTVQFGSTQLGNATWRAGLVKTSPQHLSALLLQT